MDFHQRKQARREHYERFVAGWKMRRCGACDGSGRYDNTGSPKCGSCGGTGKERYKPDPEYPTIMKAHFVDLSEDSNLTEVYVTLDNDVRQRLGTFDLSKRHVSPRGLCGYYVDFALRMLGTKR